MDRDWPLSRDLVLIGGGHTHALVLRKWGMNPLPGARLTLVNPSPLAAYTGMLPGNVAGHYARDALDIDLVKLARFAGARIVLDSAIGLDRAEKLVHLTARGPIRYDVLSINVGATSALNEVPGFEPFGHAAKPFGSLAADWQAFLDEKAAGSPGASCVVVGGGVAGVELALAMAYRLRKESIPGASVTLLEAGASVLQSAGRASRGRLVKALGQSGVQVICDAQLNSIRANDLSLSSGRMLPADFVVSAAGVRPQGWLAETGLAGATGYVEVGATLRSVRDDHIFAAGDCAHLINTPRDKAGVFAVRQAPVLFDNLRAALTGGTERAYKPQLHYLKLISLGHKSAVAEKYGAAVSAPFVWRLKDKIDARFMQQFRDWPRMPRLEKPAKAALSEPTNEGGAPLCGGCGSKVGQASLTAGLAGLAAPMREDCARGAGDDAAILRVGGAEQVISTDHLRAFTADPDALARVAAVHALGDVWSMGASPQSALLSIIIPQMSERMQADTVSEIVRAAQSVLRDAGADLVGGHTSMGCEMSIGLTVTGLARGRVVGIEGAVPGDALVLTKPIGTGVILAADMQGRARGDDVASAYRSMLRASGQASQILSRPARAMTDVTGFGLAGHLMNMMRASGTRARIDLSRVPVLPGAEALVSSGVKSTIWHSNASVAAVMTRPASALCDLLFDPQTAGGMLAAVPEADLSGILDEFSRRGETCSVIGQVEEGTPWINVT